MKLRSVPINTVRNHFYHFYILCCDMPYFAGNGCDECGRIFPQTLIKARDSGTKLSKI
jgi:hypothetical protein